MEMRLSITNTSGAQLLVTGLMLLRKGQTIDIAISNAAYASIKSTLDTLLSGGDITYYIYEVNGVLDVATSPYNATTAATTARYYHVDASSAVTFNLPKAAQSTNRLISVKKVVGANNITITPDGSETIDGASTLVISTLNDSANLISDGSNWFVH